jgi:hypothetical protein
VWALAGALVLAAAAGAAAPVQLAEPGPFPEVAVAHAPGDGYRLFWQDLETLELRSRPVDASGFPTGEVEHLLTLSEPIDSPRAAVSSEGTWLVLWVAGAGADQVGVLGALFDGGGTKIRDLELPEPVPDPQNAIGEGPSLAARPDGGFVVAWTIGVQEDPLGDPLSPSDTDAYVLRLDGQGLQVGDPVRVNAVSEGYEYAAGVAASETGVAVTWRSADGDAMLSLFGPDLAAAGPPVQVDPEAAGSRPLALEPVALADGAIAVLWNRLSDLPVIPPAPRVLLRLFAADGSPLTEPLAVDPVPGRAHQGGSIALTGDGILWVEWLVPSEPPAPGQPAELRVLVRPFASDGSPMEDPAELATLTSGAATLTGGDRGSLALWRPADRAPIVLGEVVGRPLDLSLPPDEVGLETPALPGFRVWVRISTGGTDPVWGTETRPCLAEAVCVEGRLPGRAEAIVRVIGPRPNGYLWPVVTKLTPSRVEVWMEQLATGAAQVYLLPGSTPGSETLPGMFDRTGFTP